MTKGSDLPDLLFRLTRLADAEAWARGLNPAQAAALGFLAQANRFSRAPSHLADWLACTRGTVSQTLKALAARGLVTQCPSPLDRRSTSYALTEAGRALLAQPSRIAAATSAMPAPVAEAAAQALAALLRQMLAERGHRAFGLCRTCRHHLPDKDGQGAFCSLLSVVLHAEEADQRCAEHAA